MDNLGRALKLLDKALGELEHPVHLRSRMPFVALRLAAASALALVDMAVSLRCVTEHLGYEEASDDTE